MGKKRGSSWFAALKRAICSPSKSCRTKSSGKRVKTEKQDQEDKKREVSKANANQTQCHHNQEKIVQMNKEEAAAAATAEIYNAAVIIQTAFRGYLARRALLALKGIVKLQALIRGQNVRKQAKSTLRCIQALVRLQTQMYDQQERLSDGRFRKSMFAESNNFWDRHKQDIRQRKSISAVRSSSTDEWDLFPCIIEDDEAMFKSRKEGSFRREKALAYALSQQLWRFDSDISNKKEWLNQWMATKKRDLEERCHSTANTPSSVSKYSCNRNINGHGAATTANTPHYMTFTVSAKAKARSVSTLKERPSTSGRERVRKRLSYPVTEQHGSV